MKSSRLLSLPPYLFEELENRYDEAKSKGRDIINLSIGDPDLDPPPSLISRLEHALARRAYHRYPPQRGLPLLKDAIRRYLSRHHDVAPTDEEILVLIGSKEGIGHLPLAVCNPGDSALIPDPGYPVYQASALFAGCRIVPVRLEADKGFLPDFTCIREDDLKKARLCFLNYPNNPTSAVASGDHFDRWIEVASENGFILANDAAYADIFFDSRPPALVSRKGALNRQVIEFFSFSKVFCATGWRIGFAVGHAGIIDALAHVKANIDSGVFGAVQEAVAGTLDGEGDDYAGQIREEFRKRRDTAANILQKLGFQSFPSCATFYLWVRTPSPWSSMDYALMLLEKASVLVTPGSGFGTGGEGFFRIALTRGCDRLAEAGDRLSRLGQPPGTA